MKDYTEIDNSIVWNYLSNGREVLAVKFNTCLSYPDADIILLSIQQVREVNEIIKGENTMFFVKNEDLL